MGAMYLTAAGATQDEAIGELPELPYPIGPNQNTPVTMLPLQPPLYEVKVRMYAGAICMQNCVKRQFHCESEGICVIPAPADSNLLC